MTHATHMTISAVSAVLGFAFGPLLSNKNVSWYRLVITALLAGIGIAGMIIGAVEILAGV